MKQVYTYLTLILIVVAAPIAAQQLPDSHFENWSNQFKADVQLKDWNGSNVSQVGFKFTFLYQKPGRSGYCAYVADKEVGAFGIKEVGPGYVSLGTPWQYLKGLSTGSATAGTEGGIAWTHRPDTMSVWIKRQGEHTDKEDFHLLYYAWAGTAKGDFYKSKNGGCTSTERINEESDIRLATDGNECHTVEAGKQVAEGWLRTRATYNEWTQIKVPILYMSDAAPQMCNVIFSAGNYPAFRANDGLYEGNSLWIDDVELIYASTIQQLIVGGVAWKGFDSYSSAVQIYHLPEGATEIPSVVAVRGAGTYKNIKGQVATFTGRTLGLDEMTIQDGIINGAPMIITVRAEDGSSSHVYRIKFVR